MMSTPSSPAQLSSSNTQQQLDELEALIQRMLALPVQPLQDNQIPLAELPSIPIAAPAAEDEPEMTTFVRSDDAESPRGPMRESFDDPPTPGATTDDSPNSALVFSSQRAFNPADEQDSSAVELQSQRIPFRKRQSRQPTARIFQPLVQLNRGFDRLTLPLGGVGRWLRSSRGRSMLGWTGITLITAALVWTILDWIGWIW